MDVEERDEMKQIGLKALSLLNKIEKRLESLERIERHTRLVYRVFFWFVVVPSWITAISLVIIWVFGRSQL